MGRVVYVKEPERPSLVICPFLHERGYFTSHSYFDDVLNDIENRTDVIIWKKSVKQKLRGLFGRISVERVAWINTLYSWDFYIRDMESSPELKKLAEEMAEHFNREVRVHEIFADRWRRSFPAPTNNRP
jgi:hypothetical protein